MEYLTNEPPAKAAYSIISVKESLVAVQ